MKHILKCSWLLLLVGCSSYKLPEEYKVTRERQETYENSYVRVGEEYLYRTTIAAYGHTFGGLLAAKITDRNSWRVALTTDFGNTLFDFEKNSNGIKVHYAMPDINKKIIIRTLTADFEKLLISHFAVIREYAKGEERVWECIDKNDMVYLFFSGEKELKRQLNTQGKQLYTTFGYDKKHITITHHTLDIKIDLEAI